MNRIKGSLVIIVLLFIMIFIISIKNDRKEDRIVKPQKLITVGFSQVGAESDWRTANSISIKNTFTTEKGYDLIFEDARQMQSNQILAIRSFIQQDVDYIIFSPVVENGWDTVLEEAKRANIPIIIIDRMVNVKDDNLYDACIGSDFYLQGKKACETLKKYIQLKQIPEVNIVNIQGTLGSTSQIARTKALEEAIDKYGWNLIAQEEGDYNEAKAFEVMTKILQNNDNIDFVYCENDNEAFGVIDAIEQAGKSVGPNGDIQVVSFDATSEGLRLVKEGKIIINVECNPLQGPTSEKIVQELENGIIPKKQMYLEEKIFTYLDELSEIYVDGKKYDVEKVNEELIQNRDY